MTRVQNLMSITCPASSEAKYECEICKDVEWVQADDGLKPCKCREIKRYKQILKHSGISKVFQTKILDSFTVKTKLQKQAKETALDYIQNYSNRNSIAFIGSVGCGKTHLGAAIANELMGKGIGVLYENYRDMLNKLKQSVMDEENYNRELNKYKKANVLFIDDLFKGMKEADIKYIYEVVNYRYFDNKKMIITSERRVKDWLEIDEAVGSRLYEMCQGNIVEFEGKGLNYRLGV